MKNSCRNTNLWAPDVVPYVTVLVDRTTDIALAIQVLDPNDEEYGSYRPLDSLVCQFPGGIGVVLTEAYSNPNSGYHRSDAVVDSIRLALEASEERFQYEDGSIDSGSDKQNAANAAFATGGIHQIWERWQNIEHPLSGEIIDRCRRILVKFGFSCRTMGVFTPNHRWVACAAMAIVNEVEPDEQLVAKIDDYLSDGIDQDADGFYSEYSPMYAMLCNMCFLQVAKRLDRPELLIPVRKNLELLLSLCHPGGQVASEFSVRADTGKLGVLHALVEMGVLDRRGEYLTIAREHLDRQLRTLDERLDEAKVDGSNSFGALLGETAELMALAVLPATEVEPKAVPDNYRLRTSAFINRQRTTIRIRRGKLSVTAVGRNDFSNLVAFRYGDAIVDGMRIMYNYYGMHGVIDETLPEEDGEIVFSGSFTEYIDGPTPERRIDHKPELHYRLGISEIGGGLALSFKAQARHKVSIQLEFAARPEGRLEIGGQTTPLLDGERHYLNGPASIVNGTDALEFGGDLVVQHRELAGGNFTKKPQMTSLIVAPRTPYEGIITIRGRNI
ncbi:hypothetical protein CMK21_19145 [Candidatus Poribacteria bacterium]|nr:hypothetical protein [Candidatus Poribacteria bacterium]